MNKSSKSSSKASTSSLSASSSAKPSSSSEIITKDDIRDFNNKIAGNFFNTKNLALFFKFLYY